MPCSLRQSRTSVSVSETCIWSLRPCLRAKSAALRSFFSPTVYTECGAITSCMRPPVGSLKFLTKSIFCSSTALVWFSITVMPMAARMPDWSTLSIVCSMSKYMSEKKVLPDESISAAAISLPCLMSSGVSLSSYGQIWSSSHCLSGRSSAYPRSSVIAACVWVLKNEGIIASPEASSTLSARLSSGASRSAKRPSVISMFAREVPLSTPFSRMLPPVMNSRSISA